MSIPAGDATKGEKLFKTRCAQCHVYEKGAGHRVGPNLNGLFGRMTGSAEGFSYSAANKNANIVWSEETLFDYLEAPQKKMKGMVGG